MIFIFLDKFSYQKTKEKHNKISKTLTFCPKYYIVFDVKIMTI